MLPVYLAMPGLAASGSLVPVAVGWSGKSRETDFDVVSSARMRRHKSSMLRRKVALAEVISAMGRGCCPLGRTTSIR